jgi:hypothetical protein
MFFADCAARSFFDQVANKWSVMILTVLIERPTRFNDLRRRLEGISARCLLYPLLNGARRIEAIEGADRRGNGPCKATSTAHYPSASSSSSTSSDRCHGSFLEVTRFLSPLWHLCKR